MTTSLQRAFSTARTVSPFGRDATAGREIAVDVAGQQLEPLDDQRVAAPARGHAQLPHVHQLLAAVEDARIGEREVAHHHVERRLDPQRLVGLVRLGLLGQRERQPGHRGALDAQRAREQHRQRGIHASSSRCGSCAVSGPPSKRKSRDVELAGDGAVERAYFTCGAKR